MSLTYTSYTIALQQLLERVSNSDTDFTTILPDIIDYAEQRIYRELDLLTQVSTATGTLTANNRNFTYPSQFVVTQDINVITPVGAGSPDTGTRNALTPTSKETLTASWPSSTGATVPTRFAMLTDQSIILGPWPDQAYTIEVVGTQRPTPLSASNSTTWLSLYVPDLFLAASMVFACGWLKNFGGQADAAQQAVSWETQYQTLKSSAEIEELRKKFAGPGWTSQQPSSIATPPRS